MTHNFKNLDATDEQLVRASALPAATLFEANLQKGALPSQIKPAVSGMRLCGRALTVQSPPRDNLWLHKGIYAAKPGDILVIHVSHHYEAGYWGEIMSFAAKYRKLGGLVIDGCVRDRDLLEEIGFPVFSRGLCIRGTEKDKGARGSVGAPIVIGSVEVHTGDIVVGDADGVAVVRADWAEDTLDRSEERERKEAKIIEKIQNGETTLDLFNLN